MALHSPNVSLDGLTMLPSQFARQAISALKAIGLVNSASNEAVQRARYITLETIAPISDDPIVMLSAVPGA